MVILLFNDDDDDYYRILIDAIMIIQFIGAEGDFHFELKEVLAGYAPVK